MKLASLRDGRDGRLIIVSRDLTRATTAGSVPTLQAALDNWDRLAPGLHERARQLETGEIASFPLDSVTLGAPLPRAYQWADGSAYVNHVRLVRLARGADMPESFWTDPLMYQGASDLFLGANDPIPLADDAWGCDFEAELAVITGDVPLGATLDQATAGIRLLGLVNDVSLRNLIPGELAKGFGFFQSKPASALGPVLVTPDELGAAWDGAKAHLPVRVHRNGTLFGEPNAGTDMTFDYPTLIAHAARTRSLGAGTVLGAGTISNRDADGGPGLPAAEGGIGYACIAEQRAVETIRHGKPATPFLTWGETVRIEMLDATGASVFGAIEQVVARP